MDGRLAGITAPHLTWSNSQRLALRRGVRVWREMLSPGKGRKGGSASGLLLIQHPAYHQELPLKVAAGLSP